MSKRIGEHLRSNVVGYVAIFLFAVGGTAYATHPGGVNTISSADIINGEVNSVDIAAQGVKTADIEDAAVNATKLNTNSVNSNKVLPESLTGSDIANTDSVGSAEIGGLTGGDITDGTVTGADLAPAEAVTQPTLNTCDGVSPWITPASLGRRVGFFKDRSGVVHLQGSIGCAGNATEGGAIFTLPPGYGPAFQGGVVRWPALSGGVNISQIAILDVPSGVVVYDGPDNAAADNYISLDGLTFRP